MEVLSKQRRAVNGNGNAIQSFMLEKVEQEREVEFQVEEVRQVQKPTHYKALAMPGLHTTVSHLPKLATSLADTATNMSLRLWRVRASVKNIMFAARHRSFLSRLEFMRTIELGKGIQNDNFLVSLYPIAVLCP
jgi:hypothetical protein